MRAEGRRQMAEGIKLEQKIEQLTAKVEELKVRSHIDPIAATPDEIVKNAEDEQKARISIVQLESAIAQLQQQLEEELKTQNSKLRTQEVERGFKGLVEQSDRVAAAVETLQNELAILRDMGKAIASRHKQETGKLALDDRIDRNFRLPKVERLNNSVIVHTEARNLL